MSSTSSPAPSDRHHTRTSTGQSASSYLTYPVSYAVSGLLRRLNSDAPFSTTTSSSSPPHPPPPAAAMLSASLPDLTPPHSGLYTPPRRHASPFQPPPLTPLALRGFAAGTENAMGLVGRALAEEIRLLLPPRLQLVEHWAGVYSLAEHGVSLATLYQRAEEFRGKRGGFVLVVRDGEGGVFGAYLSDPPHPSPHFYGTGECFLWRASTLPSIPSLASLPPPPSADTTHATRMTTLGAASSLSSPSLLDSPVPNSSGGGGGGGGGGRSGAASPERIRFKAFPYSGENDYMIFCEQGYLSIGGGDGHYGLWLDDNLENGVSDSCPTFGNESLSEQGNKFDVMGVELWYIGS